MRWLRTACGFAAVVAAMAGAAPAARGAGRIYWGTEPSNTISFANLDGSGGADLTTTGATTNDIVGVAIDAATNTIYWANNANGTAGSISYESLSGGGAGTLTTAPGTVDGPFGLAIDPAAGKLYWANSGNNTIAFAELDGSGGGTLNTTGATVNSPAGVAVDPAAGKIYWANFHGGSGTGTISYANLDNTGNGHDLTTTGATVDGPEGVAIDPVAGRIYWGNYSGGTTISFASLNGTGGGDLVTTGATVNSPSGVAIDTGTGRIYWANSTNPGGGISYANLTGGGGGSLATGTATVTDPAFPVLLEPPYPAGAPTVSGGSTAGSILQCSPASWAPDVVESFMYRAPRSVGYQWVRDGVAIAGATASTYLASAGGTYRCQSTATNAAGSTTQASAQHFVAAAPKPPPPLPRPRLTDVRQSHRRWREGNRLAAITRRRARPPIGTTFSFTLNEPARVRFAFSQQVSGRRFRGRCVAQSRRHRHGRRCPRILLRGTLSFTARRAVNRVTFQGRVSRHRRLRPGRYTLTLTATNPSGRRATARLSFTILR